VSEDNAPLTTTFKFGKDYDAPWVVLRSTTPDHLAQQLAGLTDVADKVAEFAKKVHGVYSGQAAQVQAAPQAPAAPAPAPWETQAPPPTPSGFSAGPSQAPAQAPQTGKPYAPAGAPAGPDVSRYSGRDAKKDPYYQAWAPLPGAPYNDQPYQEAPVGNRSGRTMKWMISKPGAKPWRAWMSTQGQNTPAADKDDPIFYD
jgi:hypothetical protein